MHPAADWIKISVDGSTLSNPGPSGGGGIARNHDGEFLFAFSSGYSFNSNGKAEIRVIWEGLSCCQGLGYIKVEVASDSKSMVESLNNIKDTPSWPMWYWWSRTRALIEGREVIVSYSLRESNVVVDGLARKGKNSQSHHLFRASSDLPPVIRGLIILDRAGLGYLRGV
ncbi:uncharacterized protein LOC131254323 [Magnolia sinica]|uniref:uncharacterized protein LOC131254323 n=1 Tax=Magnolia sinica TaxID=86752 RepID=UPI00265B2875|nr:uncharacterized protein LOC131254323 [Magnolia sinica]